MVQVHSILPVTSSSFELTDETSFATVHVKFPSIFQITVRVCVYCAVVGSTNTVLVPSM